MLREKLLSRTRWPEREDVVAIAFDAESESDSICSSSLAQDFDGSYQISGCFELEVIRFATLVMRLWLKFSNDMSHKSHPPRRLPAFAPPDR
jgi:hypothetical protein